VIRSIIDALLRLILDENTSVSFRSVSENASAFAAGRAAIISVSNKEMGQRDIGIVGEVSPHVLEKYGLKVPTAGFEINLDPLLKE
jgi:phenylalanyl-tRNA synthetase beta subunit